MGLHNNLWKTLIFLAVLAPFTSVASSKKLVCYFGAWSVYREGNANFSIDAIPTNLCTHIIYSFIGLTEQGQVSVLDQTTDINLDGFNKFVALKSKNKKLKALVAVGGGSFNASIFSAIASSPSLIDTATNSLANFLNQYNFDGLDLDWEFPLAADKANFVELMIALKKRLIKDKKILTAAVSPDKYTSMDAYDIKNMAKQLNWIHLMTYDYHYYEDGATGYNAPLISPAGETSMDLTVKYWIKKGMPIRKIVIGFPFYGKTYTLTDESQNALGSATSGPGDAGPYSHEPGFIDYFEVCELIGQGGWTVVESTSYQQTYMYKGKQWISFDNSNNAVAKARYANKYGGVMVWEISGDDANGRCMNGKYPLLTALHQALK